MDVTTIDIPLQIHEFSGEEKLGENYQFEITFICEAADFILEQWLQLPARLSIHGVIQSMEQISQSFRFSTYRISIVPIFSLLSLRHNYQIFQQKAVHEIISEMYSQAGILNHHYEIELHHRHESRDYCVQYGETDAQFVQRLMAEEGLISYFDHTEMQSKLIISDGKETHTNLPELEFMPENGMAQEHYDYQALEQANLYLESKRTNQTIR